MIGITDLFFKRAKKKGVNYQIFINMMNYLKN